MTSAQFPIYCHMRDALPTCYWAFSRGGGEARSSLPLPHPRHSSSDRGRAAWPAWRWAWRCPRRCCCSRATEAPDFLSASTLLRVEALEGSCAVEALEARLEELFRRIPALARQVQPNDTIRREDKENFFLATTAAGGGGGIAGADRVWQSYGEPLNANQLHALSTVRSRLGANLTESCMSLK